ncbi:MAG: undecaprenyldiphospho-muramoylpentapeptide beta-N-acetylglucosaminyltransferase [Candidatus Protistobacter heckmanni]|nr:undecaprenyldiphospho-muramoylpentapeptide beta-N-acetylglucosaminyltransferase [Candidatus Protistobacter heckmanni]
MSAAPCLMVMAGGTGGHVFPGLAVAEHLRGQGWRVSWLGNAAAMEGRLVSLHGITLESVSFGGLRGKGLRTKLLLPLNLLRAFGQSLAALRRVKPDVVLGMGGYISFPGGVMARLLGIPLVLHEQNSMVGLANRALAKIASRVLAAFPGALPGAAWVGNPVRADLAALDDPVARYARRGGPLRILVVGGSLGAAALNKAVPEALAMIPSQKRPQVVHQSGAANLEALATAYRAAGLEEGPGVQLKGFIDDMASAYADADLVICRAGAMTVSEVAAAGVAALFVPFPFAVDDHQTSNARFLAGKGAAMLMQQSELTAQTLAELINAYLDTGGRTELARLAQAARVLAKPQATQEVAQACAELVGQGGAAR